MTVEFIIIVECSHLCFSLCSVVEQAIMGDMGAIFSEDGVVETFQNDKEALAAAESNVAVSASPEHRFPLEMNLSCSLFCQLTFLGMYYFPSLTSAQ